MFYAPARVQDDSIILSLLHNNDTQQVPLKVFDDLTPLNSKCLQVTVPVSYLAGPKDLKHEGQTMRDQLLSVLLFLDAAELFQETLDQRSAVLTEARSQRL